MSVRRHRVTPFLWYDGAAEEAARHYVSIFKKGSRLTSVSPMSVTFELEGQPLIALNGGPTFKFINGSDRVGSQRAMEAMLGIDATYRLPAVEPNASRLSLRGRDAEAKGGAVATWSGSRSAKAPVGIWVNAMGRPARDLTPSSAPARQPVHNGARCCYE
jgi:hypothetical protein